MSLNLKSNDILDRIEYGLKLSIQKLYQQKAAKNEMVVVSVNGTVKQVSARKILKQQYPDISLKQNK